MVEKIVPALIADGAYQYSYLGIAGSTINAQVAEANNIADGTLGVYVAEVVRNGPADDAGVEAGDVIVAINDQPVSLFESLISYLFNNTKPGDTVTFNVKLLAPIAMEQGLRFAIREGGRTVGAGVVTKISK